MTPSQEAHIAYVLETAREFIDTKYRKGAQEHGGDLGDLSSRKLAEEILCEAADLMVYAITLLQKLPSELNVADVTRK